MPDQRLGIMDLVREAGVDVTSWAVTKSGLPVVTPQANPQFCYEWAFGGKGAPMVLCIWHDSLTASGDRVEFSGNYRELCSELERIGQDKSYDQNVRSRAKSQAQRAYSFDFMIQNANLLNAPVRVIVVHGNRRDNSALGHASSTVEFRRLDEASWWVHAYEDGAVRLVRNVPREIGDDGKVEDKGTSYVDQFDLSAPSRGQAPLTGAFIRRPEVRRAVLIRSAGRCELCGQSGFETRSGVLYLETHHVIPLSENGLDHPSNVVALCADDHRRAHFGINAEKIRGDLLGLLREKVSGNPEHFSK